MEYTQGLRWAETLGQVYTGPKLRGRPPGSRNRAAEVTQETLPDGVDPEGGAEG